MTLILKWIKKLLGSRLLKLVRPFYHGLKSYLAAFYYGFPGKKMKLIGITGTKGKTTTTVFTGRILNLAGIKTGYLTTSVINTGAGEVLNKYKMSSLDGITMQKLLKEMYNNGCLIAVLEMSSQGLEQNRHFGLGGFDAAGFLNMYPEHLEAHGNWEQYRKAKSILFGELKTEGFFVGNSADSETEFMWSQVKHQNTGFKKLISEKDYRPMQTSNDLFKSLAINGLTVKTKLIADFDLFNAYFAATLASFATSKEMEGIMSLLGELDVVPGRMEFVTKNQAFAALQNLSVLVDYAHEPESMKRLLQTLEKWKIGGLFDTVIHVLSSDGAGRDDWKKPVMGEQSFKKTDYTVFTTDNYDEQDNPEEILNLLAKNCPKKDENKKYFKVIDRKTAMRKALEIAAIQPDKKTLIVSTGVGSEQGLTQPTGKMKWDERDVWRELLESL